MTDTDTTRPRKSPRWMKILLVVSLALNFIFVGTVAGFVLRGSAGRGPATRDGALQIARAMPQAERRALMREFRQQRSVITGNAADISEIRRLIAAILQRKPFDAGALRELLAEQSQRGLRIAAFGQELIVTRLEEMTSQQRAEVARNLAKRPERARN